MRRQGQPHRSECAGRAATLAALAAWLEERGSIHLVARGQRNCADLEPGSFSLRMDVPVAQKGTGRQVNVSVDAVILPQAATTGDWPLLIEAQAAGDFANANKRRKEEAAQRIPLRQSYGEDAQYILFLCGYFDSGYLGYEAAEGIDGIWERRIEDLEEFGL